MKLVTDTLGVARSNVAERRKGGRAKRGAQTASYKCYLCEGHSRNMHTIDTDDAQR